jgi:hypothetical protein
MAETQRTVRHLAWGLRDDPVHRFVNHTRLEDRPVGRSSIGGTASGSYARSRIVRPIAAVMTCTSHPSIMTPCSPRSLIPPAIQPTSNPLSPSRKFSVGRRQFGQSAIHPSLSRRQGLTPDRRAANSSALIAVVCVASIGWLGSTTANLYFLPLPQAQGSLRCEPCLALLWMGDFGRWPRICLSFLQPLHTPEP